MNHDYMHCADFTEKCPKKCFRAQLVRDLENMPEEYAVSWGHLKGSEYCNCKKFNKSANKKNID